MYDMARGGKSCASSSRPVQGPAPAFVVDSSRRIDIDDQSRAALQTGILVALSRAVDTLDISSYLPIIGDTEGGLAVSRLYLQTRQGALGEIKKTIGSLVLTSRFPLALPDPGQKEPSVSLTAEESAHLVKEITRFLPHSGPAERADIIQRATKVLELLLTNRNTYVSYGLPSLDLNAPWYGLGLSALVKLDPLLGFPFFSWLMSINRAGVETIPAIQQHLPFRARDELADAVCRADMAIGGRKPMWVQGGGNLMFHFPPARRTVVRVGGVGETNRSTS